MKRFVVLGSVVMLFFSCKKDDGSATESCKNGTIEYSDPAGEGFGWAIHLADGTVIVPENLPESYQQMNLQVNTCYSLTGQTASCRCTNPPPIVHITNISRR